MEKQPLGKGPQVSRTMEFGENEVTPKCEERGSLVLGFCQPKKHLHTLEAGTLICLVPPSTLDIL